MTHSENNELARWQELVNTGKLTEEEQAILIYQWCIRNGFPV